MPVSQKAQRDNSFNAFNYRAFLLRCWQEAIPSTGMESSWRFSLIHFDGLQTEKGFASIEDLVRYLQEELTKVDNLKTAD